MWRSRAWCRCYSEVKSEKGKGVCYGWRGNSNKYTLNLKLKPAFWLELKGVNKVHFFCSIPWTCTIPQPPEGSWQLRFHTADGRHAGQPWGQAWRHPHRSGHAAPESGLEAHGFPKKKNKKNRQKVSHVKDGNSFTHVYSRKATPLTSSWSFFKKAISSCKDSTLRSRSRRAKEALSTSYFKEKRWDMEHAKVYGLSNLFLFSNHISLLSLS